MVTRMQKIEDAAECKDIPRRIRLGWSRRIGESFRGHVAVSAACCRRFGDSGGSKINQKQRSGSRIERAVFVFANHDVVRLQIKVHYVRRLRLPVSAANVRFGDT